MIHGGETDGKGFDSGAAGIRTGAAAAVPAGVGWHGPALAATGCCSRPALTAAADDDGDDDDEDDDVPWYPLSDRDLLDEAWPAAFTRMLPTWWWLSPGCKLSLLPRASIGRAEKLELGLVYRLCVGEGGARGWGHVTCAAAIRPTTWVEQELFLLLQAGGSVQQVRCATCA